MVGPSQQRTTPCVPPEGGAEFGEQPERQPNRPATKSGSERPRVKREKETGRDGEKDRADRTMKPLSTLFCTYPQQKQQQQQHQQQQQQQQQQQPQQAVAQHGIRCWSSSLLLGFNGALLQNGTLEIFLESIQMKIIDFVHNGECRRRRTKGISVLIGESVCLFGGADQIECPFLFTQLQQLRRQTLFHMPSVCCRICGRRRC